MLSNLQWTSHAPQLNPETSLYRLNYLASLRWIPEKSSRKMNGGEESINVLINSKRFFFVGFVRTSRGP